MVPLRFAQRRGVRFVFEDSVELCFQLGEFRRLLCLLFSEVGVQQFADDAATGPFPGGRRLTAEKRLRVAVPARFGLEERADQNQDQERGRDELDDEVEDDRHLDFRASPQFVPSAFHTEHPGEQHGLDHREHDQRERAGPVVELVEKRRLSQARHRER